MRTIGDQIGALQIIRAKNLAGIGEVERRVGGIVGRRSVRCCATGSECLIGRAVNCLRRSVHGPGAADVASETVSAGDVAAPAATVAIFLECAAGKGGAYGCDSVVGTIAKTAASAIIWADGGTVNRQSSKWSGNVRVNHDAGTCPC